MALDDRRWRSMQELDEYTLALDQGRGMTSKAPSPVRSKKTVDDDDKDQIVIEPHPFFNPWVYVTMTCIANVVYISSIGGYVSASLSTIERRFQLKSSQSGAITIINDVAGMIAILFVTHFGHSRHRPRIVGTAFALSGLGTVLCALPHFVYDPPISMLHKMSGLWSTNVTTDGGDWASHDTCDTGDFSNPSQPADQCDSTEKSTSGSLIWQIGWILFGQILCGLGTCCQPLCITYLDDNVKNKRTTTIFVGIIFSTFALGPTLGYMLATSCLARPTFFYDSSVPPPGVSQGHPYYIGAWWLGFLINGGMLIIVSIPFFFFPKSMRRKVENAVDHDAVNESGEGKANEIKGKDGEDIDTHAMFAAKPNSPSNQGLVAFLSDFFQTLKRIVTNVTAMSVFLATCSEISGHVGWFIFGPKFMYTQFRLPPAKSSMLFGMMMLPGPIFGNLFASVIVRRLKLNSKGCAKMILMIYTVLVILSPVLYWLGCDNPSNAGLVVPYHTNPSGINSPPLTTPPTREEYADDLTSSCNEKCNCAPDFVPVCGSDGLTYATACHAGCRDVASVDMGDVNSTLFVDCSCIPAGEDNFTSIVGAGEMSSGFAYPGECPWSCNKLYYFLGMMLLGSLLGSTVYNPSFMLQFRSHREEDRSTALGFSNVLMKLIAFIPGPVYFGAIIERTCLLFQESCGRTGNCLVYDVTAFRLVFTLLSVCGRILAFSFFIIAFLSVRKQKREEEGFIKMHPLPTKRSTTKENVGTEQKYTTV